MQGFKKTKNALYCPRFFVPLTLSKVRTLNNKSKKMFFALYCPRFFVPLHPISEIKGK